MSYRDFGTLKAFAAILGWHDLRACQHVVGSGNDRVASGTIIEWYESGSEDSVYLQINALPSCARAYTRCVRYLHRVA